MSDVLAGAENRCRVLLRYMDNIAINIMHLDGCMWHEFYVCVTAN